MRHEVTIFRNLLPIIITSTSSNTGIRKKEKKTPK